MKRLIWLFIPIIVFVASGTTAVSAHANLIRSVPEAGAVLDEVPSEIILEFTEKLDPSFTKVELLNADGKVINIGPGIIDSSTPHIIVLAQSPLPNGTYSVHWQARSDIDGHITEGSIGFSIGDANSMISLLPPVGTPDPATAKPLFIDSMARWLSYIFTAISFGSVIFGLFVWRPAYKELNDINSVSDKVISNALKNLAKIGSIGLCLAIIFFMITQAIQASNTEASQDIWQSFHQLINGRIGYILIARLLLTLILFYLARQLPDTSKSIQSWWTALVVGSGILLTFSLQSHAAARESILFIIINWLHLVAMTIWLGGLLPLLLVLKKESSLAVLASPRFSVLALISVAVLGVTGASNWLEYVQSWEAFISTTYGQGLLLKTIVFGILFCLGTLNLFVFTAGLFEGKSNALRSMMRSIRIEIVLGILLLIFVGIITGVAPAHDALQARIQQGFIETAKLNDVDLMLRIAPAKIGDNEFRVELNDRRPHAEHVPAEVLLRFTSKIIDMGTQQVETTSADGINFTARGSFFSMNGEWEVEVILRRAGFDDVHQSFILITE